MKTNYRKLFSHMQNEHGLTLLNSEIEEIQRIVLEENKPKWIKSESEDDLAKIPTNSWVITENKNILQFSFYISHPSICDKENITHYMPITKPEPPTI